jgi:hypothetical protein
MSSSSPPKIPPKAGSNNVEAAAVGAGQASSTAAKLQEIMNEETAATPGEATILVSEFPPPPFFCRKLVAAAMELAKATAETEKFEAWELIPPPPIPQAELERGTRRAAAEAAKMRAESERLRLGIAMDVLGGGAASTGPPSNTTSSGTANTPGSGSACGASGKLVGSQQDEDGDVVAVFGEVVEDPLLIQSLESCEDPAMVRDEIQRLNQLALQGFVKLVQDLVHRPTENK